MKPTPEGIFSIHNPGIVFNGLSQFLRLRMLKNLLNKREGDILGFVDPGVKAFAPTDIIRPAHFEIEIGAGFAGWLAHPGILSFLASQASQPSSQYLPKARENVMMWPCLPHRWSG
jgi:hypothetical protein